MPKFSTSQEPSACGIKSMEVGSFGKLGDPRIIMSCKNSAREESSMSNMELSLIASEDIKTFESGGPSAVSVPVSEFGVWRNCPSLELAFESSAVVGLDTVPFGSDQASS